MDSKLVFICFFAVIFAVSAAPQMENFFLRTYPPPKQNCRNGLCPLPKRIVPELGPSPPYYQQARSHESYGEPSLCGNLCTTDLFCPENQKCCPTTCGYACQGIVHIAD